MNNEDALAEKDNIVLLGGPQWSTLRLLFLSLETGLVTRKRQLKPREELFEMELLTMFNEDDAMS